MVLNLKLVDLRAVRDQPAALIQGLNQRGSDVLVVQIHGAQISATLHKTEVLAIWLRVKRASLAGLRRLGQVGLIGFNRRALAADLAGSRRGHCLTDAVSHEPRRLVSHSQQTMKLVAADA